MQNLKLIALDEEDLAVLSAHLQDAVLRLGDMTYLKNEKRFAAVANRFDWDDAAAGNRDAKQPFLRRRSGLRFDRVLETKVAGLDLSAKDRVLALLSLEYEKAKGSEGPEGYVTLTFSGGAAIRLKVECIEAELRDLGAAWATHCKPEHADDKPTEGR